MRYAVDVSNLSPAVTADSIAAWKQQGISHMVIACQFPDFFRPTADLALAGGLTIAAYRYLYWPEFVVPQVEQALETIKGYPVERLWLDIEDEEGVPPSQGGIRDTIRAALDACGTFPRGLYTGLWWWQKYAGLIQDFKDEPLWAAQWDNVGTLSSVNLYGGWTRAYGKQYASHYDADYDVFDDAPVAPVSLETLNSKLDRILSALKA